ncbi:MAG: hypothetical protein V4683_17750 [Bacteroidota bacterium]
MQKTILTICSFLFFTVAVFSQEKKWAVGARIGEPAGLNIRRYSDQRAFDINIGTYGGIWGNNRAYRKGHYTSVGLAVNANYLWHGNFLKKEYVKYYYGFGGQFNNRKYFPKDQQLAQGVTTLSIGGDALAGIEFFVPDSPLSIFLEGGVYVEVLPSPLFMHVQNGIGARFNF